MIDWLVPGWLDLPVGSPAGAGGVLVARLMVESTDTFQQINPAASANACSISSISGQTCARCQRRNRA